MTATIETTFDPRHIRQCERCGAKYDWRRSPSTLKMTYCGSLCERGALGFTIDALLQVQRRPATEVLLQPRLELIAA